MLLSSGLVFNVVLFITAACFAVAVTIDASSGAISTKIGDGAFTNTATILELNANITLRNTDLSWITDVYTADMHQLTHQVRNYLSSIQSGSEIKDTLAVMILFAFSLETPLTLNSLTRLTYLHCSLTHLTKNLAPFTDVHVYIWVKSSEIKRLPAWLNELPEYCIIMTIPDSSWQAIGITTHNSAWNYGDRYSLDYFLMGRWRNTFQFSFVNDLGYDYMLQLDDDSFIMDPLRVNLVDHFRQHGHHLGTRNVRLREEALAVQGLPEFVKYWMVTRNAVLPAGSLFANLSPDDIHGLHSDGWNKLIYCSCFMIFDVKFWMQDYVLDFMNLLLKTGSDVEQRWNDQGVQNMVRLLFIPNMKITVFDHLIAHGKPSLECLHDLGCGSTLTSVGYSPVAEIYSNGTMVTGLIVHRSNHMIYTYRLFCLDPPYWLHAGYSEEEDFVLAGCVIPSVKAFIKENNLQGQYEADSMIPVVMARWRENRSLRLM
jgi:hypothetical protein